MEKEKEKEAMATSSKVLSQKDLADRWYVQPRTIYKWRMQGSGPPYVRIGRRVLYRIEDVEEYEKQMRIVVEESKLDRRRARV